MMRSRIVGSMLLLVAVYLGLVPTAPVHAASSPSKTFVYVGTWSPANIYVYQVRNNGNLMAKSTITVPTAELPIGDLRDLLITPDRRHLFAASNGLVRFSIDPRNGALIQQEVISPSGIGIVEDLAVDSTGTFLYGTGSDGKIRVWRINPNGTLTVVQTVNGLWLPSGIALSADEAYVYVADHLVTVTDTEIFDKEVVTYPRDAATGMLGTSAKTDFTADPDWFAVRPEGDFVFVDQQRSPNIVTTVPVGGNLEMTSMAVSGNGATRPVLDGNVLYVANRNVGTISAFEVIGPDGMLALFDDEPVDGLPQDIALHPTRDILIAVDNIQTKVQSFRINASGGLSPKSLDDLGRFGGHRLAIGTFSHCAGQLATIYVQDDKIIGVGEPAPSYTGTLNGTTGNDVIVGTQGDDTIFGGDGNDRICGAKGDDTLFGQDGNDRLYGQQGNDDLDGGSGDDFLNGAAGTDALDGGPGTDKCKNGEGGDLNCEL